MCFSLFSFFGFGGLDLNLTTPVDYFSRSVARRQLNQASHMISLVNPLPNSRVLLNMPAISSTVSVVIESAKKWEKF